MNKDQIIGWVEAVKGSIKESTGKAVGNKNLQHKGKAGKAAGNLQVGFGDLKKDISRKT